MSIEMSEKQLKIAIYANELNNKVESGVKVYTREILSALCSFDNKNKYYAYLQLKRQDIPLQVDNLGKGCGLVVKKTGSLFPFWTYIKFPSELRKDSPDVLFMPIQAVPFMNKPHNIKIVVTIHDIAFRLFPSYFTLKKRILLDFHTKRAAKMADRIIVPSEATKSDVMKFYAIAAGKIKVIYHGVEKAAKLAEPIAEDQLKTIRSYGRYILYTGSIQPRKNITSLISAFEKVKAEGKTDLKLVISGPKGWMWQGTFEAAKKCAFSKDIIFTGNVSSRHLHELYRYAHIFVTPSLYEGFGLPVIEAMESGIPCAISNNSSLSEIGDSAALLFDPMDVSDIAKKIKIFLQDEKLRNEYSRKSIERANFFSWEKAAKLHVDVFENM